jgi:hypothetical protein
MVSSNMSCSSPLTCGGDIGVGVGGNEFNAMMKSPLINIETKPSSAEIIGPTLDYDTFILCIGVASALHAIIWVS